MKSDSEMTGKELLAEDAKIRAEFEAKRVAFEEAHEAYKECKARLLKFNARYQRVVGLLKEVS